MRSRRIVGLRFALKPTSGNIKSTSIGFTILIIFALKILDATMMRLYLKVMGAKEKTVPMNARVA